MQNKTAYTGKKFLICLSHNVLPKSVIVKHKLNVALVQSVKKFGQILKGLSVKTNSFLRHSPFKEH